MKIHWTNKLKQENEALRSGFTLKQENAIWAIIQHLAKEQFQNTRKVYKRKDVFDLIKAEVDW